MIALLLACGGSDSGSPAPDVAEAPLAYDIADYTDQERPEASFDSLAVEEALQTAIDDVLLSAATPVVEGYAEAMSFADADCPTLYDVDGNTVWYDYCTTDEGATFSGYGFYYVYDDVDVLGAGVPMDGAVVTGLGRITGPDGTTIEVGGTAGELTGSTEDLDAWVSVTAGSFAWDAPEAEGTWLEAGLRPSLTMYAITLPEYGLHYLSVEGGLDGLEDVSGGALGLPTATFAGTVLADEAVGFPCDQEPSGSISVRDPNGAWYTVDFDVDAEDGADPALNGVCDGCGEVTHNDVVVGEACADFSAWLDWGESPW